MRSPRGWVASVFVRNQPPAERPAHRRQRLQGIEMCSTATSAGFFGLFAAPVSAFAQSAILASMVAAAIPAEKVAFKPRAAAGAIHTVIYPYEPFEIAP